jgi:hypothetical protein
LKRSTETSSRATSACRILSATLRALHVERLVHATHAAVGDDAPDLVAVTEELPDARVVLVADDRDLRRARERRAVDGAEPASSG